MTLSVAVCAGLGVAAAHAGAGTADLRGTVRVSRQVHLVRPGETVWGIARSVVGPGGDPRPLVDAIVRLNRVGPGPLQPGEELVVPAG